MCYLGILPYFLDEKKGFSRCLSAKDAIRKPVEADNPFLEHRLFSAQTEKNISSRKYMHRWEISLVARKWSNSRAAEPFVLCKRRMPCFFSLYLLYWKTPG